MANPLHANRILERAIAGSRWLIKHQNQDGSWKGLRDPKVDAFYKSSWAFTETGQSAAAHRSLAYVQKIFFTTTGDFVPRKHPWHITAHYPYVNSYFIVGCMLAGRYELAMPAISFLLTQQAADHGGFYSRLTSKGEKETADTTSSSIAGIACLAAGKIAAARRVGDYLSYIVKLQTKPKERLFTALDADGRLYTEPQDKDDAFLRIIDTKNPNQCWFAVGLPFAFLVRLADATKESRYLDLARWYFHFQMRCVNPWDSYSSGKAGWGCAMIYRSTGEASYRDIALHVAEFIMSKQNQDGGWACRGRETSNADFDITAEFTLWLSLISANLLARDDSGLPSLPYKIRIPKQKPVQPLGETVRRTVRAHYRILRDEGIGKYLQYSYNYRKGQVSGWIKRKA
jgi:hypothetical protein